MLPTWQICTGVKTTDVLVVTNDRRCPVCGTNTGDGTSGPLPSDVPPVSPHFREVEVSFIDVFGTINCNYMVRRGITITNLLHDVGAPSVLNSVRSHC